MTAKSVLKRCRSANEDMRRLQDQINRYRDSAMRITRSTQDGREGGEGGQDKLASIMADIDHFEQLLHQRRAAYQVELLAANKLIDALPSGPESRVAVLYYIEGKALTAIAQATSYSYGYVCSLRRMAAQRMAAYPQDKVEAMLPRWYLDAVKGASEE